MSDFEMPTATAAADAIRRGELKAADLLEASIDAIERDNDALNAFVYLDYESARAAAADVDDRVAAGDDPGPFAGVPIGVKDLEDCVGMPTSHGSLLYKDLPPATEDSIHLARLRRRGRGVRRQDRGSRVRHDPVHQDQGVGRHAQRVEPRAHAWRFERWISGRGGRRSRARRRRRATAVAPRASRRPSAGLVGMKPTHGRIPHPTADPAQTAVYGVEVTCVHDAARHLDITSGPDDIDRTTLPPPTVRYEDAIENLDVSGLRIGWSSDLGFAVVDPEVIDLTHAAAELVARGRGHPARRLRRPPHRPGGDVAHQRFAHALARDRRA